MVDEPTLDDVSEDDERPANKADLRALDRKIEALKAEILRHIHEEGQATRRHFDVVAENIHHDVAGANADELSLIRDQRLPDHERRLRDLERIAGLPTPSRRDDA